MDGQTPEHTEALTIPVRRTPWQRIGRQLRLLAALAAAIAGLYVLGDWVHDRFTHVYIDDARIGADVISISSRVSLPITTVWRWGPRVNNLPAAWPTLSAISAVIG